MARGKAIWFIDAAYPYHEWSKIAPGTSFDYLKLKLVLEEGEPFWQTHYFNSTPNPPTDRQDAFHMWLAKGAGFIVHLAYLGRKQMDCPNCQHHWETQVQKGIDVGLATNLVTLGQHDAFETAVVLSGDGDLRDALRYVRDTLGKNIELVAFYGTLSPELEQLARRTLWVNGFVDQIRK